MDTASSAETLEMPPEDWISFTTKAYEESNKKEVVRTKASRKRKATEKQPLNAEEKFQKKWEDIISKYIGLNLYEEKDAGRILRNLLSEGYKIRTKQRMKNAIQRRNQQIDFLREDQANSKT
jgi:hypothetical protein